MRWTLAVGLALPLWAAAAFAQESAWKPVPPPQGRLATAISLGRPAIANDAPPAGTRTIQVGYESPIVRLQAPPPDPVPGSAPGMAAPVPFMPGPAPGMPPPPPSTGFIGSGGGLLGCEALGCLSGPDRRPFQSDHCFDGFISPVSNPFLFEDPRSLTEVRPIFMYQQAPEHNWAYRGGDIEYLGLQARVAVTERLSFVMNKFGWVWDEPNTPNNQLQAHSGLSEIWLGPKYTFLRLDSTKTVAAGGLTFQIPAGPDKVAQNTGTLSMVPYVSVAQNFAQNFNFLSTLGYSFATDTQRSDYLFWSWHLDYDIGGLHRFYPLVELNWFHYTSSGNARNLGFEGQDLFNFGSMGVSGQDSLSIAFGGRVKINDFPLVGLAFQCPHTNPSLMGWRTTLDLIFRY